MRYMKVHLFFLLSLVVILLSGCHSSNAYMKLCDLGGIFSVKEKDLDFSLEVSGKLTEGNEGGRAYEQMDADVSVSLDGAWSNQILRWGIARKTEHQTPNADPGTPQLLTQYGGLYLGDVTKNEVYLTFDEGYENGYTGRILDTLRDQNAKAVFFITGPYLNEHQDLVRRMVEEGHTVGNHTIHHPSLPSLGDSELEEEILGLDRVFQEKFGQNMRYLRPPKGEYSERTLAITQKLGYRNMFWSFAYDDWYRDRIRGAEYAYNIVMKNLHPGAILLLHAVSKDNTDALERIIQGIREQGYEIGNVDDIR